MYIINMSITKHLAIKKMCQPYGSFTVDYEDDDEYMNNLWMNVVHQTLYHIKISD